MVAKALRLLPALLLAFAGGCLLPEPSNRWDEGEPAAQPAGPAQPTQGGDLVVRSHYEEHRPIGLPGGFMSLALFDEHGVLIERWCPGRGDDTFTLLPGKYVLVATIEKGVFSYEKERLQAVVNAGRSTVLEIGRPPEGRPGEAPAPAPPPPAKPPLQRSPVETLPIDVLER